AQGARSKRGPLFPRKTSACVIASAGKTINEMCDRDFVICRSFVRAYVLKKGGKIMSTAVAEQKETQAKPNQLEQLKKFTKVVADTADFESIKDFKPQDATTNPSLVYAATQKPEYAHLVEEVLADREKSGLSGQEQIEDICDHLLVQFGCDILEIVPGRVSTE